MKVCRKCNIPLTKGNTRPSSIPHRDYICNGCTNTYQEQSGGRKRANLKLRADVINAYGTKCAECGETKYEFLTIDHIKGGGVQHRKTLGDGGFAIYRYLRKNNYPAGFRTLCYNCNFALGHYHIKLKKRTDNKLSKIRDYRIAYNRKLKADIIKNYGGKCTCCGSTNFESLSIDHINGGGKQHRAELGGAGNNIYIKLRQQNYPKDNYQLLCMNCNSAKGHYGQCPHQLEKGAQ